MMTNLQVIRMILVVSLLSSSVNNVVGCGRPRPSPPRDRTKPTLHCPNNIHVINEPRQDHKIVTWDEPEAIDNGHIIRPTRIGQRPGRAFSEGATKITYSAKDNSGNVATCQFTITVTVVRCVKFDRQNNGWKWCHPSHDMRYGTKCDFGCYDGFELDGQATAYCQENGKWTIYKQPSCRKKVCDTLYQPNNDVSISCSDSYNYRSICSYSCKQGYGVKHGTSQVRVCGADGQWKGSEPICVDVTTPEFTKCPYVVYGYAGKGKTSGTLSWNTPKAKDNSGSVTVNKIRGPNTGDDLPVGEYDVTYTARDSSFNTATCSFKVIMKQILCPTIYPLPYTTAVCPTGNIFGSQCEFSCDNGTKLDGTDLTECLKSTTSVPYGIWSFSDYQPYCELLDLCPDLIPPDNGAIACDTWLSGRFCHMFCQRGYVSKNPRLRGRLHVCGNEGRWLYGNELPDCFEAKSRRARSLKVNMDFLAYDGSCNEDHQQIKQGFLDAFVSRFGTQCQTNNQCTVSDVEVICGEQTGDGEKRQKRQTRSALKIVATIEMPADMDTVAVLVLRNEVKYSLISDNFTIELSGKNLSTPSIEISQITADCENGSVFDKSSSLCVLCEQGFYHNSFTQNCTKCAKGTYQNNTGATFCETCPDGMTTAKEGAISVEFCQDACGVGTYSKFGVTPCTSCDIGTYTERNATISCKQCPGSRTTFTPGASSSEDCKEMDIQYMYLGDDADENGAPALVTINTTDADNELFLWFYYRYYNCSSILRVSSEDMVLLELAHQDNITATLFGSEYQYTVQHGLVPGVWYYISVSLKEGAFEMLVNNETFKEENVSALSDGWVPASVNITLGDPECVGSFSQFNMNKSVSNRQVQRTSCSAGVIGDLLSWRQFLETVEDGTFFKVLSVCDVINNCEDAPCLNGGACTDLYQNFSCTCLEGFTGTRCEINIDDCQNHACDNNATCIDGVTSYTCQCADGYKGSLCEVKVVDGQWASWSYWSTCSVTCGLGSKTRNRVCSDPAPDNGGEECVGNNTEIVDCQDRTNEDEECINECSDPPVIVNGTMNCTIDEADGETVVCVPGCYPGYDFDSDFMVLDSPIFCGLGSSYRWNIRNEENPNMTLPTCTEKERAENTTMYYKAIYRQLYSVPDNGSQIEHVLNDTVSPTECMVSGKCSWSVDVDSPADNQRSQRSTTGTSFTMSVVCGALEFEASLSIALIIVGVLAKRRNCSLGKLQLRRFVSTTTIYHEADVDGCFDLLSDVASSLNEAISNNNLTVTYDKEDYDVEINSTLIDGYVTCDPGSIPVQHYCIPCGPGMYQYGTFCERCPKGTFQDEERQSSCKQCEEGLTTPGLQSKNSTDCFKEWPPENMHHTFIARIQVLLKLMTHLKRLANLLLSLQMN